MFTDKKKKREIGKISTISNSSFYNTCPIQIATLVEMRNYCEKILYE